MALAPEHNLLRAGMEVDHYRVRRLLGRGAMGEVYLARDTHLGRKVALKVVHRDAVGDQDALKRFLHEARVTARFSHPHIVTIYGVGEHVGCPYVALEYLEGQTLRDRMAEERPGPKESLRIGLAIAEALAEAHSHHVLHRDLKPRNVLLPRDGRLRVVDFGLAKLIEDAAALKGVSTSASDQFDQRPDADAARDATLPALGGGPRRSGNGSVFTSLLDDPGGEQAYESQERGLRGTPAYMAPEQWAEQPISEKADIWALGTILYELFSGRHPYSSGSFYELGLQICDATPVPSLAESGVELPPGIVRFVGQCLDKKPEGRPSAEAAVRTLQELLAEDVRRVAGVRTPYRGLLPFAERHADLFFGREAEIAAFLERMREEAVLPVVGPSGAGKSSFVQAGVIPRLREQTPWMVLRFRPGTRPFEMLAGRLLSRESGSRSSLDTSGSLPALSDSVAESTVTRERESLEQQLSADLREAPTRLALKLGQLAEQEQCRVLLFVDQLEELYTLVSDEETRRRFMLALCTSADDPAGPVRTVFTLRDDFLWRLAEGEEARDVLGRVTVLRPPSGEALTEILERPLAKVGYRFEDPELARVMVDQVREEAAALPLLQFAAQQLWEHRDREERQLTHAAYAELGGVAGALARHADGSLAALSAAQVGIAREIFLRLVTPENTRRVMSRSELLDGLGSQAAQVLERFTAARTILVRKGRAEAELELVHESLITQWGRLSHWLEESREEREFLSQVGQAAALWEARNRPDEEVWTGAALEDALLRTAQVQTLPEPVRRFLAAGKRRAERALRRRQLILAGSIGLLALVAVAAVAVGWALRTKEREAQHQKRLAQQRGRVAERQRREAVWQRAEALREGARSAFVRGSFVETRAKLRAALEARDSALARALWWRLGQSPQVWTKSLGATLYGVDFAPHGRTVAVGSMDHAIHLLDVQTQAERVLRGHTDQILAVAYRPDGRALASGTYGGEVRLWDLASGSSQSVRGHRSGVTDLAFSPDGGLLASAGADSTIRLWDARTAQARAVLKGHAGQVMGVSFHPNGRQLASVSHDKTVRLWAVKDGAPGAVLKGHTGPVLGVSHSPDGRLIATCGVDKTIRIWDAQTGHAVRQLIGHQGIVQRVRFSPDGRRLVSGGADETVRVWEVATGRQLAALKGHRSQIRGVAFHPDGHRVVSAGWDQTVRLWDLRRAGTGSAPRGHVAQVNGVGFGPQGRVLVSGSVDRTVRVWDVRSGRTTKVLKGHKATVWGVAVGPHGKLAASTSSDKTVRLWRLETGRSARVLRGHGAQVFSAAFHPTLPRIATASADRSVRVWELGTGRVVRVLTGHKATVWNVAFDRDGRLASVSDDKTVRIWPAAGTRASAVLRGHTSAVFDVRFSPDGRTVASASDDRTVRLWTAAPQGGWGARMLGPHLGRAYNLDFDPSGPRLGVACSNGSARLWNLRTGKSLTLRGHGAEVNGIRFSPDGRLVATTSDDGTVRLWDAGTGWPRWRAPLLRRQGPELLTHGGWVRLGAPRRSSKRSPRPRRWRTAVRQRARLAVEGPQGKRLCLGTHDGHLELWDVVKDRRLHRWDVSEVRQLLAPDGGCLSLAAGTVRRHERDGTVRVLRKDATAIGWTQGQLAVAAGREVLVLGPRGGVRQRYRADVGVTAIARVGPWLVVGFKDGGIELIPTRAELSRPGFTFEDTPASPVVRLISGPRGTVVAGFGNGVFGLWSLKNGTRLEHRRLHGAVVHLLLQGARLYGASELGQHAVLDLDVFHTPYCELLRKVWERVPVVWKDGLPVRRPPPRSHRCFLQTKSSP